MSAPDYYEQYLWAKAVEAAPNGELSSWIDEGPWCVEAPMSTSGVATGPTLEAALRALLDDLGVEYEERPEVEDVEDAEELLDADLPFSSEWRDAFARAPLTVLALLAGDQ